jgi:hypothetical protein
MHDVIASPEGAHVRCTHHGSLKTIAMRSEVNDNVSPTALLMAEDSERMRMRH